MQTLNCVLGLSCTIESVFICRLCIHSKTFSNVLIESVTWEKKIELFVYGNDKGEILTSREVLYTKFCKRNYIKFLFCKKDTFQNKDFSLLNDSLSEKNNWYTRARLDFRRFFGSGLVEERTLISSTAAGNRAYFLKISQVSADEEMRWVK